jgi:archaeal flagellin FlaB
MKTIRFIRNKAGDMGIGAMIVFIAMVLVAGIAASVLVQTANKLEIQAMQTGQETTAEVATGIAVDDICGQVGTYDYSGTTVTEKICNATIAISPRSGSKDIDLSKVTIEVSDTTSKIILNYTATLFATIDPSGIFASAAFDGEARSFGIIVLNDADGSCIAANPVINRGDHVVLTITPGRSFSGWDVRTDIWGMVIPEEGSAGIFAFRTPSSMPDTIYDLY